MNDNSNEPVKPVQHIPWSANPEEQWAQQSESFYHAIYSSGKCKYCHKPIHSHLEVCGCPGMIKARQAFKAKLGIKSPAQEKAYNPDKFTEPIGQDTFDMEQEERISPTIEEDVPF